METKPALRTLGLIGGLGVGAGIFYYRWLVRAHLALGLSPRILLTHGDVNKVLEHASAGEKADLAVYLAGLLDQLSRAGAELAVIPALAPQICERELAAITPLPLIDPVDAIVAEVKRRGLRRVAIMGARVTMETGLFGKPMHAEVVEPIPNEVEIVSNIYKRIVEREWASQEERNVLLVLAHKMIDRGRLDAVVFAGTDLALALSPEEIDFPYIDGARIHLEAIMKILFPELTDPHAAPLS